MPESTDPTMQRRQLLVELRRARVAAKLTQREAAEILDWSPSKLLRIENGSVGIAQVDLRALLALYGVKDQDRIDELVRAAKESKKQPFAEYRGVLPPAFLTYLGFEASASISRQFQPQLIPGLLQTQEYAEHSVDALDPTASTELNRRRVEARMERQELFERDHGEYFFILDEAVIRRQVGGPGVMVRQLERLKELGARDKITIQVIQFSAGAHYGMGGPFIVLEFADPNADSLLYLENDSGGLVSRDNQNEIADRLEIFFNMEKLASPPGDLDKVLDDTIADMRPQPATAGRSRKNDAT